ncbi:MAG TPA: hypothetical protein VGR15_10510, partial [Bacteroidota bacterium]|nr:hypothetical protein [Bacteroidota bacterium]
MHKGKNDNTALILSGGGWPGAYDIVRALGRAGIDAIVASSQPDDIAFYSRYTCGRIHLPRFESTNHAEILSLLIEIASATREKPVLFYTGDSELEFMRRYREELSLYYRFLLPPRNILEELTDKSLFYDMARSYDLPVPFTRKFANAAELQEEIETVPFPCIVKPPLNRDWFWRTLEERRQFGCYKSALRRFDSRQDLLKFCTALPDRASGFLVQSYIESDDRGTVCFNGYFDDNSQCLGHVIGQDIRTNPPETGESAYSRTVHDEGLAKLSIEYLQRLQFRGIVKIDYKWD